MEGKQESDFLKFQRKVNTLLGMPLYINFMNKFGRGFGTGLAIFHQCFTEMLVILVTIGHIWAIPQVYQDINVLCGCLSSGSHSTQVVVKTFLLRIDRSRYMRQIQAAHSLQKETVRFEHKFLGRHSDFPNYCRRQTRYINVIIVVQLLVNFMATSAYFLPFFFDSIINSAEVARQVTPVVVYLPTDFHYTPLFQVVIGTITLGFFVVNLKTVVIDNFVLSCIVFHMSELKYHNELLKEIVEKGGPSDAVRKDAIREWVKQHLALARVCSDFKDLLSPFLLIEFTYTIIHTCMPAFVITSTFSWNLPQKVSVFFFVGGGLIELYLMSSAGGDFSDTWTSTGKDFIQPEYFFDDEKWMRLASSMIQQRVRRPYRLSAFNVIPLNRATFTSILRLIVSYYMTLNQIQKMKRGE